MVLCELVSQELEFENTNRGLQAYWTARANMQPEEKCNPQAAVSLHFHHSTILAFYPSVRTEKSFPVTLPSRVTVRHPSPQNGTIVSVRIMEHKKALAAALYSFNSAYISHTQTCPNPAHRPLTDFNHCLYPELPMAGPCSTPRKLLTTPSFRQRPNLRHRQVQTSTSHRSSYRSRPRSPKIRTWPCPQFWIGIISNLGVAGYFSLLYCNSP